MKPGAVDLLIIGAGIGGLGLAQMARRYGLKSLVLEAGSHIGGAINSHYFQTEDGDYWAELGGHTCYNSYGNLLQLLEEAGQLDSLVPKLKLPYRMLVGDRLHSIPSQLNLFELLGVLPRLWVSHKAGKSVKDYFGGIIGSRNYRQVLGPALDAVVCQPSSDFPAESLFRKKPRRKEVIRSYTGASGLQSFIDAVSSGLEIRTQSPVTRIERMSDRYLVEVEGGEPVQADRLALAVAPDIASGLLAALMPELACHLAEIEMAEIDSQAVLIKSDSFELEPLAGIIAQQDDFYSVVSRDPVPDDNYRAFTFHFKPDALDEVGRLGCIARVLGIEPADIIESASYRNRLPSLRLGHYERISLIDQQLKGHTLALTGNWFSGVSIEDTLIRSNDECQRLCKNY
ncbi:MAG: FAD-dependent oxidoreductase [Candidatus Thiodiazotropha lotti]|uniref:Protoporphyrinogen oxidase n=1 Tax=Candidatus Thiodiazotropha endoloripes TaxID=1818881 RepID=A0A1E2UNT1_9GAMM|nr:FAD-dependent oxidoreductase [Candidatus Thiodiazotropha endoloripes]MCG7899923.1 FAD-dependent oxidoreductase [Candidatus Thiodiazotropha weberae]MCG7993391.1 FAD-dependent oxidoreductase [Candidatus Thiodiazotropha lotti]MCG7901061.1 FAD-dependent oxidoreductase [Candidatus Thiodiazotropha weberae]MCG7913340.1 FAD-dependent oxidoreductase [Candidatus Thiodiazotropha weberae]MCG7998091.1 FAD-dependent oxidoreductase [Candidatus Thiodiazotropha lotti]